MYVCARAFMHDLSAQRGHESARNVIKSRTGRRVLSGLTVTSPKSAPSSPPAASDEKSEVQIMPTTPPTPWTEKTSKASSATLCGQGEREG